jgi:hypothetical protein
VLLELPQRDLGGQLPAWDDLVAFCAKAREQDAALHLDGARLWQCGPFYERELDRPLEPLQEAALDQAERTGTFLGFFRPTGLPDTQRVQLTIGPASLEVPVVEARALWQELLAATREPVG